MKRLLAFLPLIALVLLAVVFVGWSLKRDPHVLPHALVGKPLPAITLAPLQGGAPVTPQQGASGPYLVNFFARSFHFWHCWRSNIRFAQPRPIFASAKPPLATTAPRRRSPTRLRFASAGLVRPT